MNKERFSLYRHVFWDFDGVIKDSVSIKEQAFVELFRTFGPNVAEKVREHHRANGGMSRLEKIPHYFREFARLDPSDAQLHDAFLRFESLVYRSVVESPWVPGARNLLLRNPWRQKFYLVTATPKQEIDRILPEVGLAAAFEQVFGSPETKAGAIAAAMRNGNLSPESCLMIGDSRADYSAARQNAIDFLARVTPENEIIKRYVSTEFRVKDFCGLAGSEDSEDTPDKS